MHRSLLLVTCTPAITEMRTGADKAPFDEIATALGRSYGCVRNHVHMKMSADHGAMESLRHWTSDEKESE
jgi:hypothetical protein